MLCFFFSFPFPDILENDSLWYPFPNCGNGLFSFPSHSRICYFSDGNQNGNWITMRDTNFFSFLYLSQNSFLGEVNWAKRLSKQLSEWKKQDILLSLVANSFAAKVLVIMNKIILFWFLFINSGHYNNKKRGDYQEWRRMGLRMFGPKLFLTPHIC